MRDLKSDLAKSSLVGILVVFMTLIPIDNFLGLFISSGDSAPLPPVYYIPMFFIYGLIAYELSIIKDNLNVRKGTSFIIIFSFFFVSGSLLSILEGNFFIDNYPLVFKLILGIFKTFIITLLIFKLWKHNDIAVNAKDEASSYFKSRSVFNWVIRIIFILLLSFIIYMIIGSMAYPFTGPHMEGMIKIPTLFENFSIQFIRGGFYILVTIPIIIFWKSSNKSLLLHLIFINILLYPILGYAFTHIFPLAFRMLDGTILSLHMIAFSWLQVKFLKKASS